MLRTSASASNSCHNSCVHPTAANHAQPACASFRLHFLPHFCRWFSCPKLWRFPPLPEAAPRWRSTPTRPSSGLRRASQRAFLSCLLASTVAVAIYDVNRCAEILVLLLQRTILRESKRLFCSI